MNERSRDAGTGHGFEDDHDNDSPYVLLVSVGNSRVRSALAMVSAGSASAAGLATLQHGGPGVGGRAAGHAHHSAGDGGKGGGMGGGGGGEILRWSAVRNSEADAESVLRPAVVHLGWGGDTDIKVTVGGSSKSSASSASSLSSASTDADRSAHRSVHVVVASVNPGVADRLVQELARHPRVSGVSRAFNAWAGSLGKASAGGRASARPASAAASVESGGVAIELEHHLNDASTLGQDRALNAIAAFAISGTACIVIDAGTAITVDFIDGRGAFCGGCIIPGVQLMADALHEHTAALPKITPDIRHGFAATSSQTNAPNAADGAAAVRGAKNAADPRRPVDPYADEDDSEGSFVVDDGAGFGGGGGGVGGGGDESWLPEDPPPLAAPLPFGRDTTSAMTAGIAAAAVGAVHLLINRYAEYYEAYPRIIATGGDAPRLFEQDELVEHIVPDLTLRGLLECVGRALSDGGDEDEENTDDDNDDL